MSDDIISDFSQSRESPKVSMGDPVLFPEIPDPPPGFDPEATPLFRDDVPHSTKVETKRKKKEYLPRARVFVIGPEGNPEYEAILCAGLNGGVVLGRKEVTDLRGSSEFKVYMEWMELSPKK